MGARFVRLPSGLVVNVAGILKFHHMPSGRGFLGEKVSAMGTIGTVAGHIAHVWGDDADALAAHLVPTGAGDPGADPSPAIELAAIDDVA